MWHSMWLLGLLGLQALSGQAQYFSEGGAFQPPAQLAENSLENIVDELNYLRQSQFRAQEAQDAQDSYNPVYEAEFPAQYQAYADNEIVQPERFGNENELAAQVDDIGTETGNGQPEQEVGPLPVAEEAAPLKPIKKGQHEFVEFVEPHAKVLKSVEFLNKRAPVEQFERPGMLGLFGSSSNVVFIALVTLCCVASVVGVVGGAYYFNTVRKQRAEAFDDFTRYSPAGPGRDMLRKGRGFAGSPVAENGDESLAYKAQLHHYQQTKQKIIGNEAVAGDDHSDKSDDEADDLEEHNFSVYECPGLAPTGDIEVQNPHFGQNP